MLGVLTQENAEKLKIGMSEEEVIALFGKPFNKKVTPSQTTVLSFAGGGNQLQVQLLDGKVKGVVGMNLNLASKCLTPSRLTPCPPTPNRTTPLRSTRR